MRPALDRRPAALGGGLGLLAVAAPLLLTASFPPPAYGRPAPLHRIQNEVADLLDEVENAQLTVCLGPRVGQHRGVQGRVIGDHNMRHQPPRLEVIE
jgi:hypothetical protein